MAAGRLGAGMVTGFTPQIGGGGDGNNRQIPECPVCWARGGGGHGGLCPNAGKPLSRWVTEPPLGYLPPDYPKGRTPWYPPS